MILYFSGTGNSLRAAKQLAALTDDTAVHLADIHGKCRRIQDKALGIVFPVYFGELPDPLRSFLDWVHFPHSTYIYAVATCGSSWGRSLRSLEKILAKKNCKLAYAAVLPMIANSTPASRRHIHYDYPKLEQAEEKIKQIAAAVKARKTDTRAIRSSLFANVMNIGPLRRYGNKWLTTDVDKEKCVGCGLCVKICPQQNITLSGGKAAFGDNCCQCLACLHWCPHQAVTVHGKHILKEDQYHHPKVKIQELFRR